MRRFRDKYTGPSAPPPTTLALYAELRAVTPDSLEPTEAKKVGERWGDGAALELALLQSVSRFRDPGRGQGLAGIRRYLGRWEGKISIRSGTARLSVVPSWDDDVPLAEHLPFFPGSQVQITIPAQERD